MKAISNFCRQNLRRHPDCDKIANQYTVEDVLLFSMPDSFLIFNPGTRQSFRRIVCNALSKIINARHVAINPSHISREIVFPSYPKSKYSEKPKNQHAFKIKDYQLLRENNKKQIDLKINNLTSNDIDRLTYSIHSNVFATENNCLFNKFNDPINESVLWRIQTNGEKKFPYGKLEPISSSNKPVLKLISAVWIRYAHFYHFGHLLTETCSAIYPLVLWRKAGLDIDNINIVLHTTYKKNLDSIKELLNITGKNIYFHGPLSETNLKIKRLFIPHPTVVLRDFSSKKHALVTQQFLDLWAAGETKKHRTDFTSDGTSKSFDFKNRLLYFHSKKFPQRSKLWLSRTQLNECSRALPEEKQIEKILTLMGWKIIHPQLHPLRTQLNALKEARVVAGLAGSAFHLLYGVKDKKKIIQLTWREQGCTYDKQFESQGFDYQLIHCLNLNNGSTRLSKGYDTKRIIELISKFSN